MIMQTWLCFSETLYQTGLRFPYNFLEKFQEKIDVI